MLTDDEILARVRERAGAIRRRHKKVVAGGAVAVAVLLLAGGVAVVGAVGDDPDRVSTADDPTTTTAAPTTTEDDDRDDPTTTTGPDPSATSTTEPGPTSTAPDTTTTTTTAPDEPPATDPPPVTDPPPSTAPPATTSTPPSAPTVVRRSASAEGLIMDVTVTYPTQPGQRGVTVDVRLSTDHGTRLSGRVEWGTGESSEYGLGAYECPVGSYPRFPDPDAAPADETFRLTHTYASPGTYQLTVGGWKSRCFLDGVSVSTNVSIVIPPAG